MPKHSNIVITGRTDGINLVKHNAIHLFWLAGNGFEATILHFISLQGENTLNSAFSTYPHMVYIRIMSDQSGTTLLSDPKQLLRLAQYRMPFGKYANRLLIDLPEPYVMWFAKKGFPEGELGQMLHIVYEVKLNGLEYLFQPLRSNHPMQ